jgi:16S rRNA (guanine527-N7)-methyltransferase
MDLPSEPGEVLAEGMKELGIAANRQQLQTLSLYAEEVERWNRSFNLVKAEGPLLIVRHLLDSLATLLEINKINKRDTVADIGSGAGLPGIPLSIFMPGSRFTLVDRSERKVAFLKIICSALELPNVETLQYNLREMKQRFDVVMFRALMKLDDPELRYIFRITEPDGTVAAFKGKHSRVERELKKMKLKHCNVRIVPLKVPFLEEERHLVLLRRQASSERGGNSVEGSKKNR